MSPDENPERHLAAVLAVEETGPDEFVGSCPAQAFDRIYGGQLAAQALLSAARTMRAGMTPISVHTTFLRIGRVREQVRYRIERATDGRSLATRVVHAVQGGRLLSVSVLSFQDAGTEHAMIDHRPGLAPASPPELLPTRDEALAQRFGDAITPTMAMSSWPIEVRYVDRTPWADGRTEPVNRLWMRSLVALPDDPLTHCAVLLYAGDLHLPEPVLYPHELTWHELVNGRGVFGASLDYTMWFHRPFRFDEYLLHEQDARASANSRGLTTGRFYTRGGDIAASASEMTVVLAAEGR